MFDARAAADPRAEALARFVYCRDGKDAARHTRGTLPGGGDGRGAEVDDEKDSWVYKDVDDCLIECLDEYLNEQGEAEGDEESAEGAAGGAPLHTSHSEPWQRPFLG